jgi:hypothetical protein
MKHVINKGEFELYSESSTKILSTFSIKEDSINKKVENAIVDYQLHLKDLKEKMAEIDQSLNKSIDYLKE